MHWKFTNSDGNFSNNGCLNQRTKLYCCPRKNKDATRQSSQWSSTIKQSFIIAVRANERRLQSLKIIFFFHLRLESYWCSQCFSGCLCSPTALAATVSFIRIWLFVLELRGTYFDMAFGKSLASPMRSVCSVRDLFVVITSHFARLSTWFQFLCKFSKILSHS